MLEEAQGSWGEDPATRACPELFSMDLSLEPATVSIPVQLQLMVVAWVQFDLPACLIPDGNSSVFRNALLEGRG